MKDIIPRLDRDPNLPLRLFLNRHPIVPRRRTTQDVSSTLSTYRLGVFPEGICVCHGFHNPSHNKIASAAALMSTRFIRACSRVKPTTETKNSASKLCRGSSKHSFSCPVILADPRSKFTSPSLQRSYDQGRHGVEFVLREESNMQEGSVIREYRKLRRDVWSYRWWESGPNGNRVQRRIVLGTAGQLRDLSSARQMTTGLMREINATDIRMAETSMTLAHLADHFQLRELVRSNGRISHSTKKAYQGYLGKWIVPRWGDYLLPNIKAVEVELWLKHLSVSS
jgi:hypothetical protein